MLLAGSGRNCCAAERGADGASAPSPPARQNILLTRGSLRARRRYAFGASSPAVERAMGAALRGCRRRLFRDRVLARRPDSVPPADPRISRIARATRPPEQHEKILLLGIRSGL